MSPGPSYCLNLETPKALPEGNQVSLRGEPLLALVALFCPLGQPFWIIVVLLLLKSTIFFFFSVP